MLISDYEITEKIAEAPQAAVYKTYHKTNPDRPLVLKIFKEANLSENKQSHFLQKIDHLKVLNDPLLITPISFGVQDGIFRSQKEIMICGTEGYPLWKYYATELILQILTK